MLSSQSEEGPPPPSWTDNSIHSSCEYLGVYHYFTASLNSHSNRIHSSHITNKLGTNFTYSISSQSAGCKVHNKGRKIMQDQKENNVNRRTNLHPTPSPHFGFRPTVHGVKCKKVERNNYGDYMEMMRSCWIYNAVSGSPAAEVIFHIILLYLLGL